MQEKKKNDVITISDGEVTPRKEDDDVIEVVQKEEMDRRKERKERRKEQKKRNKMNKKKKQMITEENCL